ncbi:MAG TPA: response regulator [Rectinemataceae bacterium]|nr:response regulator [Rectinemataceae bacterium]
MGRNDKRVRIFSALEVANLCGVVNQTAINWIKNGHLKAFTTPGGQFRVYAEDFIAFLEDRNMRIPAEINAEMNADVDSGLILIVDDDHDLNTILKRMLERKIPDISVAQAFDGFEAGRIIAERHPALVFLDFDLPGINGKSLCSRIRSDPSIGKPSVISMTGIDTPEMRDEMLAVGADDFFGKPLDFEGIIARATQLLAARAK